MRIPFTVEFTSFLYKISKAFLKDKTFRIIE